MESRKGLIIPRYFTKNNNDPYSSVTYEKRSSVIRNPDGSIVFEMKDVEVPSSWSQVATDILAQKYFRKAGVPHKDSYDNITYGSEKSIKQVAHRLAGCWKYWGERYNYFASEDDAKKFYDEVVYMIINQVAAPNSPQWFNTGLNWAYGITGPAQGHSYVDPDTGECVFSKDAYTRGQVHACFIQSLKDDLINEGGIFDLLIREARVFKYGSGSGANFSNLRGKGEKLSGGGTSSGLMSFLKVFDTAAGAIKSGGTTRRASKILCLNLDHPEIENFIWWKVKEEEKVAALVTGSMNLKNRVDAIQKATKKNSNIKTNKELAKAIHDAIQDNVPLNYIVRAMDLAKYGIDMDLEIFDTSYEGKAYTTVSGQNGNNSVRIPNEFFRALENDETWKLKARTDGSVMKEIKAKNLWNQIGYCAWACADPGVQFDDTINEWNTCPKDGRIEASNPCAEFNFLNDTACNLASINLGKLYNDETGVFDIDGYKHTIRIWTVILEISILMAQLVSKPMAIQTYKYRALGLGYANIGSTLMRMGLPYDSEEGRAVVGALTAIMGGEAYATSAEMAQILGVFSTYENNKDDMLRVIRNHRRAVYNMGDYEGLTIKPHAINPNLCPDYMFSAAKASWDKALARGEQHGYRNAQTTLLAPTGTIALVMDCDTTGIEPDYALVKFKKLAGGGYFKIVNQSVPKALKRLGYTDEQIKDIELYCLGHRSLEGCNVINYEILREKGFGDQQIEALKQQLPNISDLKYAFTPWVLGVEFCKNFGFSDKQINDLDFNLLKEFGFNDEQINEATNYVCGTMTVEGSPHLKQEHYAVFDCAGKCGINSKRYISPYGHLKILAVAQPFLSGAISKTINMSRESTVQDIKDAYMFAWKNMVKATALYRDACKLSQPLNTSMEDPDFQKALAGEEIVEEPVNKVFNNHIVQAPANGEVISKLPEKIIKVETRHIGEMKGSGYVAYEACSNCGNKMLRQSGVCTICDVCGTTGGCS